MQQIINSLSVGAVYALVTVGYAMVFSVLRMINFAHTDMMMLGAYAGLVTAELGGNTFLQFLTAVVVGATMSALVERFVYRRMYSAPPIKLMTTAIGVSVILEYSTMMIFTAQPRAYPADKFSNALSLFGIKTTELRLFAVVLCAVLFVALALLVSKTKTGLFMRAAAQDRVGAMAVGINRNRIISLTFTIGGAAAAVAGVLFGKLYLITPLMGANIGIKAFVCTVVGGDSLSGAVLGALLLSFSETAVSVFLGSGYKDAVSFVVLIVVLLFTKRGAK